MNNNPFPPILEELSKSMLVLRDTPKQYSDRDLFNATIIMMDVLMNKSFELMQKEQIDLTTASAMCEKCGNEFRQLIKTYTNIDMHELTKTL